MEYKESENERIRKWIIGLLSTYEHDRDLRNAAIAWLKKQESVGEIVEKCKNSWYNEGKIAGQFEGLTNDEKYQQGWHDALEKQGEQKLNVNDNAKEMFIKALERVEEQNNKGYKLTDCDKNSWWEDFKAYTSCIIEQKPADTRTTGYWHVENVEKKPADKIEPKFHKGEWVIDKQDLVHQIANVIENVTNHTYSYDIVGGGYFNDNIEGVRLWTIQDAKDGDVLATEDWVFIFEKMNSNGKPVCYCHYDIELGFRIDTNSYIASGSEIYPATKSQRDLLFQKMKEKGYEWDAEHKQLKKIEPKFKVGDKVLVDGKVYTIKLVNEDNYIVDENGRDVQEHFSYTKDWKLYEQNNAWSEEDETALGDALWCCEQAASIAKDENDMGNIWYAENWLKSLRPQSQWKPSEGQMHSLNWIANVLLKQDDIVEKETSKILDSLYNDLKKLK